MTDKICSRCGQSKSLNRFVIDKRRGIRGTCKDCHNKAMREYISLPEIKQKRSEYYKEYTKKNHDLVLERNKRRRFEKRAMCLIAKARIRARNKNIPFDLDKHIDEIQSRIDAGKCEVIGIDFNLENGKASFDSPSIDRIDSSKGYTIDNIRIVCWLFNTCCHDWGEDILKRVMTKWLNG
jgi:hypothetical protein